MKLVLWFIANLLFDAKTPGCRITPSTEVEMNIPSREVKVHVEQEVVTNEHQSDLSNLDLKKERRNNISK